jgi:hypothetical protein
MRFIKLGLISAAVLFMLVFIISLLMPSSVVVSRAIDINAPADSVHSLVNNLSRWNLWLENYDSSKTTINQNTTGKEVQLKMDNTTVTIIESSPRSLKTIWQAGNSAPLPGVFDFIFHESSSTTTVHWQFNQKLGWYPWEKFAGIFSEKALGPFMDNSLLKLKQAAEHTKG